jgi:hypothetical protein
MVSVMVNKEADLDKWLWFQATVGIVSRLVVAASRLGSTFFACLLTSSQVTILILIYNLNSQHL